MSTQQTPFLLIALALAGCSAMTQPEDIAVAEELCAKRGGFAHVARYQHGKQLIINCRDGLNIDVRLPDSTGSPR